MTQPHVIKLGTAIIDDGRSGRRVMVAQLPGGGGRVVDLNRIELLRQTKLGEGRPDVLADALMQPTPYKKGLESHDREIYTNSFNNHVSKLLTRSDYGAYPELPPVVTCFFRNQQIYDQTEADYMAGGDCGGSLCIKNQTIVW
jgi:hypothetical protein